MSATKKTFAASRTGQKLAANICHSSRSAISSDKRKPLMPLLAHANRLHKELWEPALSPLFYYNHGDSAALNRPYAEAEETPFWLMSACDILAVVAQLGQLKNIAGTRILKAAIALHSQASNAQLSETKAEPLRVGKPTFLLPYPRGSAPIRYLGVLFNEQKVAMRAMGSKLEVSIAN
ncbi:hypothetical protein BX070DRAFT_251628 [Coemansia spiralis]|nr:hypothetical protein BX070DRAFT_251628 [Coemansia spiralis]